MALTITKIVALLPGKRRKRKHIEQATAAPGERRDVRLPRG